MRDEVVPSGAHQFLSVLVVEDELLIAMGIEEMLARNRYQVLGPVGTIEGALARHRTASRRRAARSR